MDLEVYCKIEFNYYEPEITMSSKFIILKKVVGSFSILYSIDISIQCPAKL